MPVLVLLLLLLLKVQVQVLVRLLVNGNRQNGLTVCVCVVVWVLAKCVPVSHLHIEKRVVHDGKERERKLAEYKRKVNNEKSGTE